jgi:zinc-ribbon domain
MAYCPNCAAVLDPSQKFCSRCGQASAALHAPAQTLSPRQRPPSLQISVALLLISCAISLASVANLFLTFRRAASPIFLTRSVGLTILMILLVIGLWQRQGWVRIAILALIVWGLGTLIFSMIRVAASGVAPWTFAIPIAIDALRLCAVYMFFRPESNAWFNNSA